jgi:uncharacterized protein (DUF2225 family)
MVSVSAFTYRKVTCPICERESNQRSILANQYRVEEREADQHPTKLTWNNPENADLKPQYYVLYHCPYCLFTDFEETFLKPSTIRNFNSLKKLFITSDPVKSKVLSLFKSKISFDNMNFQSALFVHLLSIYIYELETRKVFKDIKKLGRLYHRTAWLFREEAARTKKTDDNVLQHDMLENIDILKSSFSMFTRKFTPLNENIRKRVIELDVGYDSAANPYLKLINDFYSHAEGLHKNLAAMQILIDGDQEEIQKSGQLNYKGNLALLTELWAIAPMTEKDCLERAIECYEGQYQTLSSDSLGLQISLMNLMVELCIRINDFPKALEYLVSLYQFCSKSRQDLYTQQRSGGSSSIDGQINKLTDLITTLSGRKKQIENQYYKYVNRLISDYVKNHPDQEWEEVKKAMRVYNVPEDFLDEYETNGALEYDGEDDDDEEEDEN